MYMSCLQVTRRGNSNEELRKVILSRKSVKKRYIKCGQSLSVAKIMENSRIERKVGSRNFLQSLLQIKSEKNLKSFKIK